MAIKSCTATTIRAPLDEVLEFVNYHLNLGIDHMILFFDDPSDPAIEIVSKNHQVTPFACDNEHWQRLGRPNPESIEERQKLNAKFALRRAREAGYDWLAHIDSDELIRTDHPINDILDHVRPETDVIIMRNLEGVPEKMNYASVFREVALFKVPPDQKKLNQAKRNGLDRVLSGGYIRGYSAGKSMFRTSADISNVGVHKPSGTAGRELIFEFSDQVSANFILLHYDCCEYEDWKRKWVRRYDGSGTAKNMRRERKEQFREFIQAYQTGTEDALLALYEGQYFLSEQEKCLLQKLNLLVRIELPPELFGSPAGSEGVVANERRATSPKQV